MSESEYREACFDAHGRECAECGVTDNLEVHHRNGDRTDNEPENLLVLCNRHHSQLHQSGLNGWEDELKPTSERAHIDESTTHFQFTVSDDVWEDWKMTVPRNKSLEQRIHELIEADTEGRVEDE